MELKKLFGTKDTQDSTKIENKPISVDSKGYVDDTRKVIKKAFTMFRLPGGWVKRTYTLKDDQILHYTDSIPNLASIQIVSIADDLSELTK